MYGWDELFWAILFIGCFLYAVLHAPEKKKDDKQGDKKKAEKKADKKDDKAGTPRIKPEYIKAAQPKTKSTKVGGKKK